MSDDNKYQNDEFDENYDDLDFDDSDLSDEDGLYDDISNEDVDADFDAEQFDDEWDNNESSQQHARDKKEQNLYTDSTQRKGFSLSFNTMIIIGALLVGGSVMAYTIMSKTAEVNAGKGEQYRSSLNIGAVLDGTIFGLGGEAEPAPETGPAENTEKSEMPAGGGGFLDNPENVAVLEENPSSNNIAENPPMPSPITPMPDEGIEQEAVITEEPHDQIPRGPEENTTPEMSAQDILNQMKASRENREASNTDSTEDALYVAAMPVQNGNVSPESIALVPVAPGPSAEEMAKLEEANRKAAAAETKIQEQQKIISELQSKLQGVEGELDSLRSSQSQQSGDLEKTVAQLQTELRSAKDAAAKAEKEIREQTARAEKAAKAERAARAEASKSVSTKPPEKTAVRKPTPAAPQKSVQPATHKWELRAAQPGRAWVSKPGARDMQAIAVGDTLTGIGRVTEITYINGQWIVQGTEGQVTQ